MKLKVEKMILLIMKIIVNIKIWDSDNGIQYIYLYEDLHMHKQTFSVVYNLIIIKRNNIYNAPVPQDVLRHNK